MYSGYRYLLIPIVVFVTSLMAMPVAADQPVKGHDQTQIADGWRHHGRHGGWNWGGYNYWRPYDNWYYRGYYPNNYYYYPYNYYYYPDSGVYFRFNL